jgi:outer membrane immunogenic protein
MRMLLKKWLPVVAAVAAVAALTVTSASAADLPVKTPPVLPAPVPATDWSGFYVDADLGWEHQSLKWFFLNVVPAAGEVPFSLSQDNGIAGGHVGYQQQFGWFVIGGEYGATIPFNTRFASVVSPGGAPGVSCQTAVAGNQCQARLGDFQTAGGKAGVAWQDWLAYGVGGAAWGTTPSQSMFPNNTIADMTTTPTHHGWYAGFGVDWMAAKTRFIDVILGVEYEHVALGTVLQTSSADTFSPFGITARTLDAKADIAWAKLTVKFNPFAH